MKNYVLGVDVGNTNTVFGLFENNDNREILYNWRTATHSERTSDELGIFLISFLQSAGISQKDIQGFIYSSVVPSFNSILENMAVRYFSRDPLRAHAETVSLEIDYPNPREIGADRLVNAVAAKEYYGRDLIVIDLGTATTFCVIRNGIYCGGIIAPGLSLSMEALTGRTAQLPAVTFRKPPNIIGKSTVNAMESGFFYSWKGMLSGIISEIKHENPEIQYRIAATGGFSELLNQEIPGLFDEVDSLLTLRGLKLIYRKRM